MSLRAVQEELVIYLPNLRAFAISLCGNIDHADDLVQEALLRAWNHLDTYQEGTNMRAWLFTILRNAFLSERRRQRDELSLDGETAITRRLGSAAEQHGRMAGRDLLKALAQLNPEQRETVILIGAEGFSYEEVAGICGCAVGTVKSRVNRARVRLTELLGAPSDSVTSMPENAGVKIWGRLAEVLPSSGLVAQKRRWCELRQTRS
jgi:RNA polymerase sigma-70 factor (ECF subfamily)